jgi:hypothetical protein
MKDYISFKNTRRNFLTQLSLVAGGQIIAMPLFAKSINNNQNNRSNKAAINHSDTITVGQIIDTFISEVPGGKLKDTVDTLGERTIQHLCGTGWALTHPVLRWV